MQSKKSKKLESAKAELKELLADLVANRTSHVFSAEEIELIPNILAGYEFCDHSRIIEKLEEEAKSTWGDFFVNPITGLFNMRLDQYDEEF